MYLIWFVFRLLEGAEEIGLKKTYKNGLVKDFLVEDLRNFVNSGNYFKLKLLEACLLVKRLI